MSKKIKYVCGITICIIFFICYTVRILNVNKENDKTEVEYVSDDKVVQAGNLKISVAEQKLYDVAAYVNEYPEIRCLYTYKGSFYEAYNEGADALRSYKKVFLIKLNVTNIGKEIEEIPYFEYKLYLDKNYAFDFNPMEVEYINKASGISVRPGHTYQVKLAYSISDKIFEKDVYKNLKNMDNSIMIDGYPTMKNIKLSHIKYIKADKKASLIYADLVKTNNEEVMLPDTKENTILRQDEPYIKNGVKIYADSYEIYQNKFDGYKQLGKDVNGNIFDKSCIGSGDRIIQKDQIGGKKQKGNYAIVIVNFRFVNETKSDESVSFFPFLCNYTGKRITEYYYMNADKGLRHEKYSSSYTVSGDTTVNVKCIFYFAQNFQGEEKDYKYYTGDESKKMYIGLNDVTPEKCNLEKGETDYGIFLRVR